MKLLLTAFDPFGGSSINPALEAVSFDGYAFEKKYAAAAKPM